jgi:hypothetical protein
MDKPCIDGAVRTRALKKACEIGHIAIVERLIQEQNVAPNAQFDWAIHVAAANNHVELVDRLPMINQPRTIGLWFMPRNRVMHASLSTF